MRDIDFLKGAIRHCLIDPFAKVFPQIPTEDSEYEKFSPEVEALKDNLVFLTHEQWRAQATDLELEWIDWDDDTPTSQTAVEAERVTA
jgi:hypothetical protein